MLKSLQKFDVSEIAGERLRILHFYQAHGEKATKEAFGVDRKLISRWRQKLTAGQGKLQALRAHST